MDPKREMMYIHRIQSPTKRWSLRFRYLGKVIHNQIFRDDKYGSKERALEAAINKRTHIAYCISLDLDEHFRTSKRKDYRYIHQKQSKRNHSGVIGVSLWDYNSHRYWRAGFCKERYEELIKLFSVKTYGEKEAFKLAVAQRKEWEQEFMVK